MSQSSAQSWFFPVGNDNKPLPNSTGTTAFSEATTRIIVHGQPCKVCEANCVVVNFPFGGHVSGSVRITTLDRQNEHWVNIATQHISVAESREDGHLAFFSQVTPWIARSVDEQPLSEPWPNAGAWAENGTFPTTTRWFIEQTLSSSISGETFVSTLSFQGLFVAYAAADWVAAGYVGGAIFSNAQVVTHWTSGANSTTYLDAQPFDTPVFTVNVTHGPSSGNQASATMPMRVDGGQSFRIGRLDKFYSPSLATGPDRVGLNGCDNNTQHLKQRRVSDSIYNDAPYFRYGTTLRVDWRQSATTGLAGFVGNYVRPFSFLSLFPSAFGDPARLVGTADIFWDIPWAGLAFANKTPTISLTQSLHDGRNSSPHEWHYWDNWNESDDVYTFPPAVNQTYQGIQGFYQTQAVANQFVGEVANYPLDDVFYGSMEARRRSRKLQARVFTSLPFGVGAGVSVRLDLRFTWLLEVVFQKQALQVADVEVLQQPNNGFWYISYRYFVNNTVQDGCTVKYRGERYASIGATFSKAQWENVVMAGGRAEVGSPQGGTLGIQFA